MESTVVIRTVCKCSVFFFFQEQDKIAFPCPSKVKFGHRHALAREK